MNIIPTKSYETVEDAFEAMAIYVNDDCIDGERFAYLDDDAALAVYADIESNGCCGSHDEEIIVNGRRATIGCNYGH